MLHVFSLQVVKNLLEHLIDNILEWLNQASTVRWDKNDDVLQVSSVFGTFVVCLCVLHTHNQKLWLFSIGAKQAFSHGVEHQLFITPHIFLELHPHSSVVLGFLRPRSPQAFASEKEKWRYMSHSISKDGQLSSTRQGLP